MPLAVSDIVVGKARRAAFALAFVVTSTALVACTDSSAPVQPPANGKVSIAISGPDSVRLPCSLAGSTQYGVHSDEGSVSSYAWKVDGVAAGSGATVEVSFIQVGTHNVHVDAFNGTGALLASADKAVVTRGPEDLSACASSSRIQGRFGVLIPTGSNAANATYSAVLAPALDGHIDVLRWLIQKEGEAQQELASGADVPSVDVAFSEGGAYVMTLEQTVGGATTPVTFNVNVRRGEPLAEPGTIALFRRFGLGGPPTIYLLDAASGFLSEPLLHEAEVTNRGSCSDTLLVFNKGDANSNGVTKNNVYAIKLDGSDYHRVIKREGNVSGPNMKGDIVAVVDDTRWNYLRDELALLNLKTGDYTYLAGAAVDSAYVGFWPALDPHAGLIALGSVENGTTGKSRKGIVLYTTDGRVLGPLHTRDFGELYGWDGAIEGVSGVAWDPLDQYVAFDVLVGDEKWVIALGTPDGSEVKVLGEGRGPLYWSPTGDHLLFQMSNYDSESTELMMMNRDGTGRANITRSQLGTDATVSDVSAGYCVR